MGKSLAGTCESCGGQLTADARFCFRCGAYEELQGINGGYWTYTYEWRP